jgi:hypothetical protein
MRANPTASGLACLYLLRISFYVSPLAGGTLRNAIDGAIQDLGRNPTKGGREFDCWTTGDSYQNASKRVVGRAPRKYVKYCESSRTPNEPQFFANLHFHDLRHIATSRLAKRAPNVVKLYWITVHSDLKFFSRHYHVSAAELAERLG